jgi:hypothetical protein
MLSAIESPIALQSEYRPPTQSQNSNMFAGSIPNARTSFSFVESATKCFATAASSFAAAKNQSRAVCAFVSVSCVVNVFEAMTNSVVSGRRFFNVSTMCVPSMFETKCARGPFPRYGFSASVTITGPKSEPPMPMLTKSVIGLPVYPTHAPDRTACENSRMCSSTRFTSGITSFPSTRIGRFDRLRSAMCSTARFSVMLIFSPENIFRVQPATSRSAASSCSSPSVSPVIRFFEKSSRMPSNSSENFRNRSGSAAKRSRISTSRCVLKCSESFFQAEVETGALIPQELRRDQPARNGFFFPPQPVAAIWSIFKKRVAAGICLEPQWGERRQPRASPWVQTG